MLRILYRCLASFRNPSPEWLGNAAETAFHISDTERLIAYFQFPTQKHEQK